MPLLGHADAGHADEGTSPANPALAPIEVKLKGCVAANPGNLPERRCTDDARGSADAVLNKLYGRISAGLKKPTGSADGDGRNKELLKRLIASERAWIAYRDAECLHRAGMMLGGSGEGTIEVGCAYSFERERVNDLTELYRDQFPEIVN